MNHVSVCIKRSALEKCGGYETMHFLEDYYLWLRMIACGCKFENMKEALVLVRVGNGFLKRRRAKVKLTGWYKLQQFMLKNKMINKPGQKCSGLFFLLSFSIIYFSLKMY